MSKATKALNILVIILTVIMSISCISWIYFATIGKSKIPSGITSTNITEVTDPQTGETKQFLEAAYFENVNGLGKEVVELRMNAYSGVGKQAIYSRGFQLVIENGVETIYYYDTHVNESFASQSQFGYGDTLITTIDDKLCGIKLDGTYSEQQVDGGKLALAILMPISLSWNKTIYKTVEIPYTYVDVLHYIKMMIKSSSYGTGNALIPMADLAGYFGVYEMDENGQISGEDLGKGTQRHTYFSVQSKYSRRGMVYAGQSLFGIVANDSDFNLAGIDNSVEYWKTTSEFVLTEKDFECRQTQNGNLYYLSIDTRTMINNYENIEVYVDFNVSNLENVLGFDYLALEGIKVEGITLRSKTETNFVIYDNSLKNTGLTVNDIICENVVIGGDQS